ncbi:S8 family peptidase [Nonomuraea jiangxiensis]|uniref:Subtilase family protein n=1 Tax=Nonomuraea jiangxiensis TaxID=633440 RepID=A0A1G8W3K6_9ACTN|nr:S8/S53 family peptidase [Nonomuraea jiangxiensis]SDJ72872.1 Subtilase family protein [Nonomuraea jiangxiensis]
MTIEYIPEPQTRGGTEEFGLTWQGITLPREILDRHGARILDPWSGPLDQGERRPDSTVYRSNVLLVPGQALISDESVGWIDGALSELGLRLSPVSVERARGRDYGSENVWMPAVLEIDGSRQDVDVDAWRALRALRRALSREPDDRAGRAELAMISLDHLFVGSATSGIGSLDLGGEPATSGHAMTDQPGTRSRPEYGRMPVTVVAGPPPRRPLEDLGGPRITVVTLDTGVAKHHPWFRPVTDHDAFLSVDPDGQRQIEDTHPAYADRDIARLVGYEDLGLPANPLLGMLNTHAGHGLMLAGLVAQIAPDARVLMYKVMHSDGIVPGEALHAALDRLLWRLDHGEPVDVLCCAFGGFSEAGDAAMQALFDKVNQLRARGVIVVNAAGNYATTRPFYLAALSETAVSGPPLAPMIGVAAKNPDGTIAIFSNEHPAVRWRAPGAMVVSTFPPQFQGAQNAALTTGERASLDVDAVGPFCAWSGTSFAAPIVAGCIAAELTRTIGQVGVDPVERARSVVDMMINDKLVRPEVVPI